MGIAEDQSTAALQLVGAARSGGQTIEMRRLDRAHLVLRFGLSGVSYPAIIGAGILLLSSLSTAFATVLLAAIVVLLVNSLRNTWGLLVTSAR